MLFKKRRKKEKGDMSKLAIHGQCYKLGQIQHIDRHNRRLANNYKNWDIDKEKSKENVILVEPKTTLYQAVKELVQEKAPNSRLRKDSNYLVEFVIHSPSEEYLTKEELIDYHTCVLDYFKKKIGTQNIMESILHFDESSIRGNNPDLPRVHMHLCFVPIRDNKLCCSKIMTRQFLLEVHTELAKELKDRGFPIERGESTYGKHVKSKDLYKYKLDMEKNCKQLTLEYNDLAEEYDYLKRVNYELQNKNRTLAKQVLGIEKDRARAL